MKLALRRASVATLVAGALSTGSASLARADRAARVTVVRPAGGDALMLEVATRAWAELIAGGVDAAMVDCAPGSAACRVDSIERGQLTLTLATFRRVDQTVTRVDLTAAGRAEPLAAKTVVIAGAGTPAALDARTIAIRAVELAHAAMLDAARMPPTPPSAVVAARNDREEPGERPWAPPAAPPMLAGWSVGAGVGVVASFGGLRSDLGATAEVSWLGAAGLGARAFLGIAALGSEITTSPGALSMRQDLAALQAICRFRRTARIQPHLALGLGVYHVAAQFVTFSDSLYDSMWAALLLGGAGAALRLTGGVSLAAEAQIVFAIPHPAVVLDTGEVGTAAGPSLLLSVGVQKAF